MIICGLIIAAGGLYTNPSFFAGLKLYADLTWLYLFLGIGSYGIDFVETLRIEVLIMMCVNGMCGDSNYSFFDE